MGNTALKNRRTLSFRIWFWSSTCTCVGFLWVPLLYTVPTHAEEVCCLLQVNMCALLLLVFCHVLTKRAAGSGFLRHTKILGTPIWHDMEEMVDTVTNSLWRWPSTLLNIRLFLALCRRADDRCQLSCNTLYSHTGKHATDLKNLSAVTGKHSCLSWDDGQVQSYLWHESIW